MAIAAAVAALVMAVVPGAPALAADASGASSSGGDIVAVGTNLNGRVTDAQVAQRPYSFSGTTMTPDAYGDIIYVAWAGKIASPASDPIKPGDYLTVKVDPKLRVYGLLDSSLAKFPDLVSTTDGTSVVARSYYDAGSGTVYYVFTDFVNGTDGKGNRLDSISFQTAAAMSVERSQVKSSGSYDFSIDFAGTPLSFGYNVQYASILNDPVYNNVYQKYELTSGRVHLDWVNPQTKRYQQSFLFGPVDKGEKTIASRRDLDFGFDVLGSATPARDAQVKVYRVTGGASAIPANLDIPSSALEDVTSKFNVTSTAGGGLRYAPKQAGTLPTTDYYYVVVQNGYDSTVSFDSGATPQNYDSTGTVPSDMAHVSYANQLSTGQLAGIATPTYASRVGKQVRVTKTDADGKPLAGATFQLLDANGTVVATLTTGADGTATSALVPLGTYTLHESAAPAGYKAAADTTVDLATLAGNPGNVTVVDEKDTTTTPGGTSDNGGGNATDGGGSSNNDNGGGITSDSGEKGGSTTAKSIRKAKGTTVPQTSDTATGLATVLSIAAAGAAAVAGAVALRRREG